MAYNIDNFPDEWSVPDDDQIDFLQDFDHTWLEQSLASPLQFDHQLDGTIQVLPRSMSLVQARYATSETSMSSVEEPPTRDQPIAEDRPKRGRKPKSPKDGESPVEVRKLNILSHHCVSQVDPSATSRSIWSYIPFIHSLSTSSYA